MELGGVMLGAGMILGVAQGDYLHGDRRIEFMIGCIVETRHESHCDWVVLDGTCRPTAVTCWHARRIQVRVSALKRSLTILA